MAQNIARLSVRSLSTKGPGLHADGRGLYFQVKNGGRSWILRYSLDGKARYMGLGSYPDTSLADARTKASKARQLRQDGIDPIEERRERRRKARLEAARFVTFESAAQRYIEMNKAGWKNAKHALQWEATLKTYAYPVFGSLPVQSVDTGLVMKALGKIWNSKTETATRLRQRIECVLDWATAHGYRTGENPARWRGHLNKLLPKASKVRKVKHFAALPYAELPGFFADLGKRKTASAKALAFTILTAARSGETRLARLVEINFEDAIWTIPGERTKSGRDHRVPLTKEALALVARGKQNDPQTLLFPNDMGEALSDATMRKYLQQDMAQPKTTVHGFRSTFKDWATECTNFPGEISEAALGHVVGDKTEAAYRRGDALNRRRRLMEAWTKFATSGPAAANKVVALRRA